MFDIDAVCPDVVVDQLPSAVLDHESCCEGLISVVGVVLEVDVLELTDVEVGSSKFTSPFWECRCCTIEDGRCW